MQTDLTQVSHLPDVLDFVLSCPGGDHHLGSPLAQLVHYIRPDESIAPEHGSGDAACLRGCRVVVRRFPHVHFNPFSDGAHAPKSAPQLQWRYPCSSRQIGRIPSNHQRRCSLAKRHLRQEGNGDVMKFQPHPQRTSSPTSELMHCGRGSSHKQSSQHLTRSR